MSDETEKYIQKILEKTGKTVTDEEVLEEAKILYEEDIAERAKKREELKEIIKNS